MAGWDDFRFVKAVAEGGGLTGAAARLGIDHSTAFRRLAAIEAGVEAPLFERRRTGYVPTAAGLAMVEAAERIEVDVARFSREVAGRAGSPAGELRVTAPVGLAAGGPLMPILAAFGRRHPAIRLDLVLAEEALNLSRRDADVALRATRGPDEGLVGRRLAGLAWAVYGLAGRGYGDLAGEDWVVPDARVGGGAFADLVRARAGSSVRLRINGVAGLHAAVAAGIGVGPLPCFEGDADPALQRLSEPDIRSDLWLLTHPDLRRAPRVRAFIEHVAAAIAPLRAAFEGRG